ncbi:MAG: hypothetical protein NVS4B12_21580 [Ktedonobacteraceae bacterium]
MKKSGDIEKQYVIGNVVNMKNQQPEPMNPSLQFCPNEKCLARGKIREYRIRIHDRTRQRSRLSAVQRNI